MNPLYLNDYFKVNIERRNRVLNLTSYVSL